MKNIGNFRLLWGLLYVEAKRNANVRQCVAI